MQVCHLDKTKYKATWQSSFKSVAQNKTLVSKVLVGQFFIKMLINERKGGILKNSKIASQSGDLGKPKSAQNVWNQKKDLRGIMEE